MRRRPVITEAVEIQAERLRVIDQVVVAELGRVGEQGLILLSHRRPQAAVNHFVCKGVDEVVHRIGDADV